MHGRRSDGAAGTDATAHLVAAPSNVFIGVRDAYPAGRQRHVWAPVIWLKAARLSVPSDRLVTLCR